MTSLEIITRKVVAATQLPEGLVRTWLEGGSGHYPSWNGLTYEQVYLAVQGALCGPDSSEDESPEVVLEERGILNQEDIDFLVNQ